MVLAIWDVGIQPQAPLPRPWGLSLGSKAQHHLGDAFDLVGVWYGGTALVILSKTNVPQV